MNDSNNPTNPDQDNGDDYNLELPEEVQEFFKMLQQHPEKFGNSGRAIFIQPTGGSPQIIGPNQLISPRKPKYTDFYIFRKEWIVRIVDVIETTSGNRFTIYLEIFPNSKFDQKRSRSVDFLQMYDYVTKTQFINFFISCIGPFYVWNPDQIKAITQIDESNHISAIRVIISDVVKDLPNWISELGDNYEVTSTTDLIDLTSRESIMVSYKKSRHMYEPIIRYEINGMYPTMKDFNFRYYNVDLSMLMTLLIRPKLYEIVEDFYRDLECSEFVAKNNIYMHTIFDTSFVKNSFKIVMICSPGVLGYPKNILKPYSYLGGFRHSIEDRIIKDTNNSMYENSESSSEDEAPQDFDFSSSVEGHTIISAIINFVSTSKSLYFPKDITCLGESFIENGTAHVWKTGGFLFIPGMILLSPESITEDDDNEIISFDSVQSTAFKDLVKLYWVPENSISLTTSNNVFRIYGIVDINITNAISKKLYNDSDVIEYLIKHDNLDRLFGITSDDSEKKKLFSHKPNFKYEILSIVMSTKLIRIIVFENSTQTNSLEQEAADE